MRWTVLTLLVALAVSFLQAAAPALPQETSPLVGTWVGVVEDNEGERIVLGADGKGKLGDVAIEWKAWGKDRLRLVLDGERLSMKYAVDGDSLTLTVEGVELRYRREGKPGPNPGERPAEVPNEKPDEEPGHAPPDGSVPDAGKGAPLAAVPPPLEGVGDGPTTPYEHPKKYFTCRFPKGWTVAQETPDAILVNPGLKQGEALAALVFLTFGRLERQDQDVAPAVLIDRYEREFVAGMAEQGIQLGKSKGRARAVLVGDVPGATKEWPGTVQGGQRVRVWLGGVVKRDGYLTVATVVLEDKAAQYLPGAKQIFSSLAPTPPKRNPELERLLAGRRCGHNETNKSGSLSGIYEFGAGSVKRTTIFSASGPEGIGGSSEEHGTFEVVGDLLYLYFKDGQEVGTVVGEGGQLVGLRFGEKLYRAR